MSPHIPESVRLFVLRYIDSVELLNVLILLHQNQNRTFTLHEIEQEIRSSLTAIQKRLDDLYQRKVLLPSEGGTLHRYQPATDEVEASIDELVHHYQIYSNRIIELIFSRQNETLRNFAEAFRIKKDD